MDIFTKLKILMSVFMFTNFNKQNVTLHFNFLCFYDKNLVVIPSYDTCLLKLGGLLIFFCMQVS